MRTLKLLPLLLLFSALLPDAARAESGWWNPGRDEQHKSQQRIELEVAGNYEVSVSYPLTGLAGLDNYAAPLMRELLAGYLEDNESAEVENYMSYDSIDVSRRLIALYGFGAWMGGGKQYESRAPTIIWDKQENRALEFAELFEDPACIERIRVVQVVEEDMEPGDTLRTRELEEWDKLNEKSYPIIPAAGGLVICLDHVGMHGYFCSFAPLESFDEACPLRKDLWE